ncbi:hypothetical protein H5410_028346, partial [Solanum commersonii]
RENHLVTFRSMVAKIHVFLSENVTTQHIILLMDLEINMDRKKKTLYDPLRIRWGVLNLLFSWQMGEKLIGMGA